MSLSNARIEQVNLPPKRMYEDEEDLEHEGEMEATEDDEDYEDPDLGQDGVLTDPNGTN